MSRVYWHTREGGAELRGSERAWLGHVARGPADAAWDLNHVLRADSVERAAEILDMVPEVERGYMHGYLVDAQRAEETNRLYYTNNPVGIVRPDHEPAQRLMSSLATSLKVNGFPLVIAGHRLHTKNVELNTALVAGSDPVRLAAKIDGWCESHAWVDEPDHEWMANIIEQGLAAGIYRSGFWFESPLGNGEREWSSQGWEGILGLLRKRDTGPVVMSFSVSDSFPNPAIAGWQPPADDPDGDAWYDLPDGERWDMAFAGLQERRPWARLAPETLAEVTFGHPVTVYDLFAHDRDRRVARAVVAEWD